MAHAVRYHRECQKEFAKRFSSLSRTKSSWSLWSDFVTIAALAIANSVDREGQTHDDREREYLGLIKRYTPEEQDGLTDLFAMVGKALGAEPGQDFLGEMFSAFELNSHWHGQFFTPYHVCEFMARITLEDVGDHIEKRGWLGISDSCCGAGALLIAARNEMVRQGHGYTKALYVGQDIDRTAALMCYVQLSLLGCAGYVIVGNSLTQPAVCPTGSPLLIAPTPEQEVWIMPTTCLGTWPARIQWERFRLALASLCGSDGADGAAVQVVRPAPDPMPEPAPTLTPAPALNETTDGQLTLF